MRKVVMAVLLASLLAQVPAAADTVRKGNLFPKYCTLSQEEAMRKADRTGSILAIVDGVVHRFTDDLVGYAFSGFSSSDEYWRMDTASFYVPLKLLVGKRKVDIDYHTYVSPQGEVGNGKKMEFDPAEGKRNHIKMTLGIDGTYFGANTYYYPLPKSQVVSKKTEFQLSGELEQVDGAAMAIGKRVRFSLEVAKSKGSATAGDVRLKVGPPVGYSVEGGIRHERSKSDSNGNTVQLEDTDTGKSLLAPATQKATKYETTTFREITEEGNCTYRTTSKRIGEGVVVTIEKMEKKGGRYQWSGR